MQAQQEYIFIFGYFVCLRLYFPVNNYSAMSAKWRLTVHPILRYQGEKGGGGGKCPPMFFLEGANIHHNALLRGQLSSPANCLGGRCPHMPFFIGGQMSGGKMSGSLILLGRTQRFFLHWCLFFISVDV